MPHLTLEYSSNLKKPIHFDSVFQQLHQLLFDIGGIHLENCKSRGREAKDVYIAGGDLSQGFVHLDVRFLEGRSLEVKQRLGEAIKSVLVDHFCAENESLALQITVEIRDIAREGYFKFPEGTLTPMP